MDSQPKQPWQTLCEQAANEQDPERLMLLVKEISRLLDEQIKERQPQTAA